MPDCPVVKDPLLLDIYRRETYDTLIRHVGALLDSGVKATVTLSIHGGCVTVIDIRTGE